jgi:peptidoglycan DL-endopeptidase CwlO
MKSPVVQRLLRALPVTLVVAFLLSTVTPTVARAQSVDQQRQKVAQIVDELERLQEKALTIGENYNEAVSTKTQLDADIADAEARIADKESQLATLRSNLSEMALRSFVGGGSAPLGPLFEDSTNLNDSLKRDELAKVALNAGNVTTDELDALVSDINDEKKTLDKKRNQAQQLADALVSEKAQTEKLTADYTKARADAEAKLGALIAQEEQRRAEESARRVQEQARKAAAASSSNSGSRTSSSSGSSSTAGSGGNSSSGNPSSGASSGGSTGSGGGYSAPSVSSRAGIAIQAALGQQGTPYHYATSTPGVGFDCSGLTAWAWGQAGVGLPHQSRSQFASTPRVPIDQAQPGDLLFFYSPVSHVSIYLGNGMQVHAPATGQTVTVSSVNWGKVVGVGRPG